MSSVYNDSEGLYGTTVCRCLVRFPHYTARLILFGSRGPSELATEITREGAVQGLGMAMSTIALEKNGIVVYRLHVLQTVTSLRVVSLVFRGHDILKIANINPQQEATLSLWKKISSPREQRKWSLGVGQHLKGASPDVRTESK